jgi:hypothetical protein
MYNIKTLLAAAAMAVAMAAGVSSANAAPWDRHVDRPMPAHRNFVTHTRVVETLRAHHFRFIADPVFVRGHYVARSYDRFGHIVLVEIDPHTGAFIGRFRA